MAKVREIADGLSGNQSNRKSDGLTGTTRKAEVVETPPASSGWLSRIGGFLAPPRSTGNTTQQGAKAARPQSSWARLLFGFMVYLLGSFILQPLILLVFGWLHINPAARQTLFPANTWIIGTANAYTLVYFVLLALFIWALFRFNIIPRDPFGARASAQRRASGTSGASGGTSASGASGASGGSGTTAPSAPSALRHAGRRRLPMTDGTSTPRPTRSIRSFLRLPSATPATSSAAKPSPKAAVKPTAKVATGTPARSTTRSSAGTAKPASARPANGHVAVSNHDGHYDRVKSLQRSRRRKR